MLFISRSRVLWHSGCAPLYLSHKKSSWHHYYSLMTHPASHYSSFLALLILIMSPYQSLTNHLEIMMTVLLLNSWLIPPCWLSIMTSLWLILFILLLSFSILCLHDIISAYFLLMHSCLLIPFTQHLTQPLPFAYTPLLSLLPILYKLLTNFLPST